MITFCCIHSVHEFADVRVYGGENAPNIFAVLYVSLMTKTLTICERLFLSFLPLFANNCYETKMHGHTVTKMNILEAKVNESKGSQVGSLEKFTSHSAKNDLPIVQLELCTDS